MAVGGGWCRHGEQDEGANRDDATAPDSLSAQ